MKRVVHLTVLATAMFVGIARIDAAPITFTFSATGTGWIRDAPNASIEPFTNAAFTITAIADTTAIVTTFPGILAVPNVHATIDVVGVGSGVFLVPTRTFVNHNNSGALGFSRMDFPPSPAYGADLIDFTSPSFLTYQLDISLGPILDANPYTRLNQFRDIAVSFGLLSFNDTYVNGSFVASVPEPTSATLVLSGCAGLLLLSRVLSRRIQVGARVS